MNILTEFKDHIDWDTLSSNESPAAIDLLSDNITRINWDRLSGNQSAICLLSQNLSKINIDNFSDNPKAIWILEDKLDYLVYTQFADYFYFTLQNFDDEADENTHLFYIDIKKVDWNWLKQHPRVVQKIYETLEEESNFTTVSLDPEAVFLFERYPDLVPDWSELSQNEGAVELLLKNTDKLDPFHVTQNHRLSEIYKDKLPPEMLYKMLVSNPGATQFLFPLETISCMNSCLVTQDQLMAYFYEPSRVIRQCEKERVTVEQKLSQIHTLFFS